MKWGVRTSWESPWCRWIHGWWRFWEVFALCHFSRFVGWFYINYHFVFWLFCLGLPSFIFTPMFVFFSPSFSTSLLFLYYLQLFALLGIIGLNFCLLLSLYFSMLGIVGVGSRSIVLIEVCRALPLLHKVGCMSFLPISSHVVLGLAEVWLDDLNIL